MRRPENEPVYMISVAARMLACHPQTLRMYEREGLVSPFRSQRNLRLYSDADIERLRMIKRLTQELGVNLAGVEVILELLDKVESQQHEIERLKRELSGDRKALNPAPSRAIGYVVEIRSETGRS
ncbi:MAG: MerR family transcriptional regulator [Armatimonadetes bacterium]|nr:MerR family transcriptional regulator [Armatimonadota bacterium]